MSKQFLKLAGAALLMFAAHGASLAAERPNVLIIMADDCTYNDLAVYGGRNALTPHIDQLAAEGLVFDRAYLCEAMCQPCRAELYTGQFPMRNGCAWNHSASRPSATSMAHHLGSIGYRVGLTGKVHVKPAEAFPFEQVGGFEPNCTREPTRRHKLLDVEQFIQRDPAEPFCLVVALVEPHVPWVMGDASKYPPSEINLPPNLADTPKTREDFASYLAEVSYMDGQVGDILAALQQSGQADDTLVLFTSEQGAQFPGCKWTNWDTGVHTALVARWPGRITPGQRTNAIVQYADVLPTLIDAAGGDASQREYDGASFLPVLLGDAASHRQFAYGLHNNVPEGPPYPIRTITDGRYRYIRNLASDELYIEKHMMGLLGGSAAHNAYWSSWMAEAFDSPRTYELVKRFMRRPAEQLYDTASDPYELENLANDPNYEQIATTLSAELDRWLASQGDPGALQDSVEALDAARNGRHLYYPTQSPGAVGGRPSSHGVSSRSND